MCVGGGEMDSEMVTENLGLVRKIANKWKWKTRNTPADYDDLYSEGCIGLMNAITTYDPEKGYQFSSYAYPLISGQILNFLNKQLPQIHYPQQIMAMIKVIKKDELTVRQLITRFKCSQKVARLAYDCAYTKVVSLNVARAEDSEDTMSLEDIVPFIDDFSTAYVDEFKSTLPDAERALVEMTARGLSKLEISVAMNIDYGLITSKMKSIRDKLLKYQAGLPYQGYRAQRKADYSKITQ
jgi:RNA polymerase sigma factor (sigma-70 family)